jgi:hypothetical protein
MSFQEIDKILEPINPTMAKIKIAFERYEWISSHCVNKNIGTILFNCFFHTYFDNKDFLHLIISLCKEWIQTPYYFTTGDPDRELADLMDTLITSLAPHDIQLLAAARRIQVQAKMRHNFPKT